MQGCSCGRRLAAGGCVALTAWFLALGGRGRQDTDTGYGTGWKFDRADAEGLKFGLWNALNTFRNFKAVRRAVRPSVRPSVYQRVS